MEHRPNFSTLGTSPPASAQTRIVSHLLSSEIVEEDDPVSGEVEDGPVSDELSELLNYTIIVVTQACLQPTHLPDGLCLTPTNLFRARRAPPSAAATAVSFTISSQATFP
uniref:Uncharacterized protein n=1 Tax=Solanum lycopersicum TaxID=4081 RepID=A0A3Q7FB77_SOLLC